MTANKYYLCPLKYFLLDRCKDIFAAEGWENPWWKILSSKSQKRIDGVPSASWTIPTKKVSPQKKNEKLGKESSFKKNIVAFKEIEADLERTHC